MNRQYLSPLECPAIVLAGSSKRPQFGRHRLKLARRLHLWITLMAWGSGLLLFIGTLAAIGAWSNLGLASSNSTTSPVAATAVPPDIPALQQFMLTLINNDRRAYGLSDLAWDSTAATAGMRHAGEMTRFGYLSHWNLDGYGPDYRYTLAGGLAADWENTYTHQGRFGTGPTSPEQWQDFIHHAQQILMASPGHRANILAAEHTHVGIGIAYEPANGWLAITQEFVGRYVMLQPFPRRVSLDETLTVAGKLENSASNPVLNLAFEPLPKPMSVAELKATSTYSSPAENYDAAQLAVDGQGQFEQNINLNHKGQAGLYHIRIWVDTSFGKVLAADGIVEAQ